jgi:hypothetical protein
MEGGDKANEIGRATKLKSASHRRANAAENPHIKRALKKAPASQSDDASSTVGPEPQPQPESWGDVVASTTLPTDDVEPQPQSTGDVDPDGDIEPDATS